MDYFNQNIPTRINQWQNLMGQYPPQTQATTRGLWGEQYQDFPTSEEARRWVEEQGRKELGMGPPYEYQGFWPTFQTGLGQLAREPMGFAVLPPMAIFHLIEELRRRLEEYQIAQRLRE